MQETCNHSDVYLRCNRRVSVADKKTCNLCMQRRSVFTAYLGAVFSDNRFYIPIDSSKVMYIHFKGSYIKSSLHF